MSEKRIAGFRTESQKLARQEAHVLNAFDNPCAKCI